MRLLAILPDRERYLIHSSRSVEILLPFFYVADRMRVFASLLEDPSLEPAPEMYRSGSQTAFRRYRDGLHKVQAQRLGWPTLDPLEPMPSHGAMLVVEDPKVLSFTRHKATRQLAMVQGLLNRAPLPIAAADDEWLWNARDRLLSGEPLGENDRARLDLIYGCYGLRA